MLTIAICDDLREHAEQLEAMVQETLAGMDAGAYTLDVFQSPALLLDAIPTVRPYDIVFIDIKLAEADGVEVAKTINDAAPFAKIIFVSSYLAFVTRIYDAKHLYFLSKPIDRERLWDALDRALKATQEEESGRLILKLVHGPLRVFRHREILYCERTGRVTAVHTVDGEKYAVALTIAELTEALDSKIFARPHNSFLVQLAHVRSFERYSLTMDNGTRIPISNTKRQEFQAKLESYLL